MLRSNGPRDGRRGGILLVDPVRRKGESSNRNAPGATIQRRVGMPIAGECGSQNTPGWRGLSVGTLGDIALPSGAFAAASHRSLDMSGAYSNTLDM